MNKKLSITAIIFLLCCASLAAQTAQNAFAFPYAFSAQDIYGRTVTQAELGEKEIFFVHYFATWCPPCVREMPDLARIAERYGNRVGFIALLDDFNNRAAAVRLAQNAGINFIIVDASHRDFRTLRRMVQSGYVPTTILIGRDGRMIGEQIIGALGMGYASHIDKALGGR
ncbi:MAG: TlpA family protein disulfide reductase [Treponema sp.]|nr:TlpA family protein disulfide reductase [Treponema sp.]MCL2237194.1 TlpA family protein disulfide reductase [Treponema sp.]